MTNSKALEALKEIAENITTRQWEKFTGKIELIRLALTELEEIKKRAEEKKAELSELEKRVSELTNATPKERAEYFRTAEKVSIIDYILKGETK